MLSDPKRFKFEGQEHYLKTADEMRYLFRDYPEACDNTLWIAERAERRDRVRQGRAARLPAARRASPPPTSTSPTSRGRAPASGGATTLPARRRAARQVRARHDRRRWGSRAYFLIVWDLIAHARRNGIRVGPGRGSAAGCAVAYCLRITDLDPIRYDLLFERFLNPSRISMPDIDMDFDSRYRDEMIRYAAEKYGREHVAQIITFGTIKARNARARRGARARHALRRRRPHRQGDAAAGDGSRHPAQVLLRAAATKYADGYKAAAELRAMYDADPDVKKVVDVAKGLEGLKRSDGIHAAAVVITKEPLTDVPAGAAQAGARPGPRAGAGRHAVRDARRRGRSAC